MNSTLAMNKINHSGKSIRLLLRRAVRAVRTNKFDDAIKFIDEVLERQPENSRANALKFTTYYMSNQLEKARQVGTKAADLNPKSDYIVNNQACLQLGKGYAEEAQDLLDSLVKEKGDNPQWLYNLGLAHAQLGKFETAIDTFNRVLDIRPDYHKALLQRASVELKLGMHENAYQTLNILRLTSNKQSTSSASHIYHGIRFNQLSQEALQQEIAIWGHHFIPKNKRYENKEIDTSKPLKIGFVIGSLPSLEWETVVKPVINVIAEMGHPIRVYWHKAGILPIVQSSNIEIKNCRSLSDADFARLCRENANDILIDVGGMHTITRERTFGINLASKQYAWLSHAGIFSTPLIKSLDEKLGNYRFAINPHDTSNQASMPRNAIAAIGCEAGLSLETVRVWSKIIKQTSKKLALDVQKTSIQRQLLKRFAQFNIEEKSIIFVQNLQFKSGQLVLDNIDYNAIAKASTALINGANVITLEGELFPAKRTAALLAQTKHSQWICKTEQDYIKLAAELISSKKKNSQIKKNIKSSGIDDLSKFAAHFIKALTQ